MYSGYKSNFLEKFTFRSQILNFSQVSMIRYGARYMNKTNWQ